MGLLYNLIFGDTKAKKDTIQYALSKEDIRKIVSQTRVRTLSPDEITLVADTIDAARKGNGKISMAQVEESLRPLRMKNKISTNDYQGLMKQFAIHVAKKKYR